MANYCFTTFISQLFRGKYCYSMLHYIYLTAIVSFHLTIYNMCDHLINY